MCVHVYAHTRLLVWLHVIVRVNVVRLKTAADLILYIASS